MTRPPEPDFEAGNLSDSPLRDLGLPIEDTWLEPLLAQLEGELDAIGLSLLRPRYYLATGWGVPFGTVAIAIPFDLAYPDRVRGRPARVLSGEEVLRYLRHAVGHVLNYAYRLYDDADWVRCFGAITQPYVDDFHPVPFSRRYVRHLPGWYAQKHPDEDWAETWAVWMTPGLDWRTEYAEWPEALEKLRWCDAIAPRLAEREPEQSATEPDFVQPGPTPCAIEQFYLSHGGAEVELPPGLDAALRTIFEDLGAPEDRRVGGPRVSASTLLRDLEERMVADVHRWTGHAPERVRSLVRELAARADLLGQVYPVDRRVEAAVAVSALVTALAMNHVTGGTYFP